MWLDGLLAVLFASWGLVSLLVLIPPLKPRIRRWDGLSLIPEWRFFAPRPAEFDFALLYRDRLADDQVTGWAEVRPAGPRGWWNVFWNPGKRARKALFDAIQELAHEIIRSPDTVRGSVPYLTLLNHVSTRPRALPSTHTQMLVLRVFPARPDDDPEMLLTTGFHEI